MFTRCVWMSGIYTIEHFTDDTILGKHAGAGALGFIAG